MLYIQNFNIKEYKTKEFQKFIKGNEKTLSEHAPKGWKYMGTYFYAAGFGPYNGAQLWEISKYADFDNALVNIEKDPIALKVNEQMIDMMTPEPLISWLLRGVGDTKIIEPKKKA
jgi:hypothetical protein